MTNYFNQHILSVNQFDKTSLDVLFNLSSKIKHSKNIKNDRLKGYVLGNLFFEASTRSRMSFSSAFLKQGGTVNSTTGVTFSSMAKGESLSDTIRVISLYCDVLVIRHPELGAANVAAQVSRVPVINAGDGPGEHPTQALLDLYTIFTEQKRLDNLTITMVGDLKYGRTVHSLSRLLTLYNNIKLIFCAPDAVQMPDNIVNEIKATGCNVELTTDFSTAIKNADVIYSTRIQKERFGKNADFSSIEHSYALTKDIIQTNCKNSVSILHPLPRNSEISVDIDDMPNAAYFRQAENGLYVRMALFSLILGKS